MPYELETRCIHGNGRKKKDGICPISVPIYQTASFAHIEPGHNGSGFDYTRESNPTRQALERVLASLEGGAGAMAFSSGMAAVSAVFELLRPGEEVRCSDDLYGGTVRCLQRIVKKNGVLVKRISDGIPANTRLVFLETPGNPMMGITDIRKTAEAAHKAGALLAVDNTFLSPWLQNPISLGADLVIHSGSKFLGGHNDTIAGFVVSASRELDDGIRMIAKTTGGALSPFDSWLILRGLKTLPVRMERQQESAGILAAWLKEQPFVKKVYYPGLPEHPGYDINRAQSRGGGSMISFECVSSETALRILRNVQLITFAESLGGTESLITYPATQTHADVPEDERKRLGITDALLRLSTGLEAPEDLMEDLARAAAASPS